MKKTLTLLLTFLGIGLFTFAQTDYQMWETTYLTPKAGKTEALKKAMADHNKKFHASGPYGAHVWSIETGKHEGDWLWVMGPCTFTDLDSRPDTKEHNDDWENNVMSNIDKASDVKYWKLIKDESYQPANAPSGKVLWTAFDIKPFEGYRFKEMMKKVVEVYTKKNYPYAIATYESQFDSGDGQDVTVEWEFDKYAWFDRDSNFSKDYEEVHGDGSWRHFLDEYKDVVIGSVDELAEFMPELSGTK